MTLLHGPFGETMPTLMTRDSVRMGEGKRPGEEGVEYRHSTAVWAVGKTTPNHSQSHKILSDLKNMP